MKHILASFCNLPKLTRAPIACVKLRDKGKLTPLAYAPVSIGFPGLITSATGITQFQSRIFVLFSSLEDYYIAFINAENLRPITYCKVPEVKDGHSLLAYNNRLFIASSGTDEVISYEITDNGITNPQVVWQASNEKRDTHHVNSIVVRDGELIVSAFGPKEGKLWSTAQNGYIYNITRGEFVKEKIYHPHSLSVRNGKIYYTESHHNTLCSLDEGELFHLNGYTRGITWLSDDLVCIASSIGRKISRSTRLVANPGDPGEPAGECGLFIGSISSHRIIAHIDMSQYGPEIYDALVLESQNLDLLELATLSHLDERDAIEDLSKRVATQEQQILTLNFHVKNSEQMIQELNAQIGKRDSEIGSLNLKLSELENQVQDLHVQLSESTTKAEELIMQLNEQNRKLQVLQAKLEASEQRAKNIWAFLRSILHLPSRFILVLVRLIFSVSLFRRMRRYYRLRKNLELIRDSHLFDANWYLAQNPDVAQVGIDPARHYLLFGGFEGRDPSPHFCSKGYLDAYPDVKQSGINPLVHYLRYGEREGRLPKDQIPLPQGNHSITERLRDYLQVAYQTLQQDGFRALVAKIMRNLAHQRLVTLQRRTSSRGEEDNPHKETYLMMLDTTRGKHSEEYVLLSEEDLSTAALPVKLLAFYLPQYHPIPENDLWWGKGFTEWTNVSKAIPLFPGHYQPHMPGELGFYDLRVPQVQRRQVELAKKYGIYGFCFYYYWFDGKTLLDYPIKQYLSDAEIDFPFCLCWANENWTRRWDGKDDEILIAQKHSQENDFRFIRDIAPYLKDKRYIRINGRPLLVVYRVNILENPAETARRWREFAIAEGLGNPYLVAAQVFNYRDNPEKIGFDAAVEFPPNTLPVTDITRQFTILNPSFRGHIYDYQEIVTLMCNYHPEGYKIFKGVMPSWDNSARQPDRPSIFVNADPTSYENWLTAIIMHTMRHLPPEERFVFINAWNEWAEGNHLEPDRKYGYAYLQATAQALKKAKVTDENWKILFVSHDAQPAGAQHILLSLVRWFTEHTQIDVKVLCLEDGDLLREFKKLAHTLLYSEIADLPSEERLERLKTFCGGIPHLIYLNSVASGKALLWLRKLGAPILTHVHELNMSIQRYAAKWMDQIIEHSDFFIACSEAVRQNLLERYGANPQRCVTAHSFIELSGIEPLNDEQKRTKRKELGLEADKFIVFGCGIGMPFRKGADLFIETAQHLLNMGKNGFHFYWIGEFDRNESDPNYGNWSSYLEKLRKQEVGKYVTFLGMQSEVQEYLRCGDIFLLTSREEPLGRVVLEAAECSLPTICFESSGGAPEFVRGEAGFVVPFEDTQAMAEKISLLMRDEQTKRQVGTRARQRLLEAFTLNHIAPTILSTARDVARKAPKVSIIVPNYNHAQYLPERLKSIFNQTFQDFEVFLMDDASTDNSVQIFQQFANRADVHLLQNKENSGSPFKQWLKALSMARGEVIWIAESDDLCETDFLEKLLPAFTDPEVNLAYCASKIIDEQGNLLGNYPDSEYLVSISPTRWKRHYCISGEEEVNEAFGVKNTILNISAVLFRKVDFDDTFKETLQRLHIAGDTYLILNLMKSGKVYFDAHLLNSHRRHRTSIVGKVLAEHGDSHLRHFFDDMAVIYGYVAEHFRLKPDFPERWDSYLHELWQTLAPGRPFEELRSYFPYDNLLEKIRQKTEKQTTPQPPAHFYTTQEVNAILERYKHIREEQAQKWGVNPEIHPDDFLFRFLLNAPKNVHKPERAIEQYFSDGFNSASKLAALLRTECNLNENASFSLLEFAAGYGRVSRHIRKVLPNTNLVACDIHQKAIDFLQRQLGISAVLSKSRPGELSLSEKFDVVFALSFFSHMPKTSFSNWLRRLASFLKPGGYLIFTTHGKISNKKFIPQCEFDEDGFYFKAGGDQLDLNSEEYGLACTLPRYVLTQIFTNHNWNLIHFREGYWWDHQDVYIVRVNEPSPE